MALRVARGLFRLWLVLSVGWGVGVGMHTWRTFPSYEPYVYDSDTFFGGAKGRYSSKISCTGGTSGRRRNQTQCRYLVGYSSSRAAVFRIGARIGIGVGV